MKNIIKSVVAVAAVVLTASSFAGPAPAVSPTYLYWMSEDIFQVDKEWTTAKVAYDTGSEIQYLGAAISSSELSPVGTFASMQTAIGSTVLASNYKFALELYNGSDPTAVAVSKWLDYDAGYIGDASFSQKQAEFVFIPEPTSGLLGLLGFGLLALRRKQKKA